MNSYELNNNEVSPKIIKFLFYQIKLIFDTFFKSNIEKIYNFFVVTKVEKEVQGDF